MNTEIINEENEALKEFSGMMHGIEECRDICFSNKEFDLGRKWQVILDAFNAFTPEEIIKMETLMD